MADSHRVQAIWRYPVKSMAGEELGRVDVAPRGLTGDRALALIDAETGKVVSAKNPRRWPGLFEYRARFGEPSRDPSATRPIQITCPDGETLSTDDPTLDAKLSAKLGRVLRTSRVAAEGATSEGYWPNHDWLPSPDEFFDFPLPAGTFFDGATVHLASSATLARLQASAPSSRFDVRRFRPNFVIETMNSTHSFIENSWIGLVLSIGEALLKVEGPCPRCVMTTLAQGDLPADSNVLRTAVLENEGNVGVYASVLRGGAVRRGDVCEVS